MVKLKLSKQIYISKPAAKAITSLVLIGLLIATTQIPSVQAFLGRITGGGATGGSGQSAGIGGHNVRQPVDPQGGSLQAYYPLNGNANDYATTKGNNLTDNGSTTGTQTFENAANFQGAGGCSGGDCLMYMDHTDTHLANFQMASNTSFTIAMMVYPKSTSTQMLFTKFDDGGAAGQYEYGMWIDGTNGFKFLISGDGSNTNAHTVSMGSAITANQWYLVTAGYDGSNIWLNVNADPNKTYTTAHTTGTYTTNNHGLRVGFDSGGDSTGGGILTSPTLQLNGYISNLAVWKTSLRSGSDISKITTIYNGGRGLQYPGLSSTLKTNLVAWWDMEESVTDRTDASGGGNTLKDRFLTIPTAAGPYHRSSAVASFNGSTQYLSAADSADLSTGNIDFAVGGWIKLNSKSTDQTIISKGDSTTIREYWLGYEHTTTDFQFYVYNSSGTASATLSASTFGSPSINEWYYVAAWYDHTAQKTYISVNGTTDSISVSVTPSDSTASLQIGAYLGNGATRTNFMNGYLGDVAFWKRTLSTTDATNLFNAGVGVEYNNLSPGLKGGLVSWWTLDEASGTRNDSNLHGTYHGTPTSVTYTTGKFGKAASFNGTTSKITTLYTGTNVQGHAARTLSAWINYTTSGTVIQPIMSYGDPSTLYSQFELTTEDVNKVGVRLDGENQICTTANNINDGVWHHVVAVFDGSNAGFSTGNTTLKLYVDGVNLSTCTTAGSTGQVPTTASGTLYLGNDGSTGFFSGSIGDARVYNVAFTAANVTSLYGGSNTPNCDQRCYLWLKMDETSGSTATDSSQMANNGTYTSNTPADGIYSGGQLFNNTSGTTFGIKYAAGISAVYWNDDHQSLGTATGSSANYTYTMWLKTPNPTSQPNSNIGYFFSIGNSGGDQADSIDTTGQLNCGSYYQNTSNNSTGADSLDGATVLQANTWYFVACVRNTTTHTLKAYVNGIQDGSVALTSDFAYFGAHGSGKCMGVGIRFSNCSTGTFGFNGTIDDVRIFPEHALTPAEIYELYLAGRAN